MVHVVIVAIVGLSDAIRLEKVETRETSEWRSLMSDLDLAGHAKATGGIQGVSDTVFEENLSRIQAQGGVESLIHPNIPLSFISLNV